MWRAKDKNLERLSQRGEEQKESRLRCQESRKSEENNCKQIQREKKSFWCETAYGLHPMIWLISTFHKHVCEGMGRSQSLNIKLRVDNEAASLKKALELKC